MTSEVRGHNFMPNEGKMPDQWLRLVKKSLIRLDRYTLSDGTPDWKGIRTLTGCSAADAINFWIGLHQGIEYRIREAHRLGHANEMNAVVRATTQEIRRVHEDFDTWERMQR